MDIYRNDEMWNADCRIWMFVFVIVCLYFTFVNTSKPDGEYILSAPKIYTAFSGDLSINYTTPSKVSLPNAYIRIVAITGGKRIDITTRPLEMGKSIGQIKITCGVIEFSAVHTVELHMFFGGPMLNLTSFNVTWPKFYLSLPPTHIAQTKPVTLLYTSEAICKSPTKRHSFFIDLKYTKHEDTMQQTQQLPNLIFRTKESKQFVNIDIPVGNVNFTCESFDAAGRYIAILRNDFDDSHVVAQSNLLDVQWSTSYKIDIFSASVHPCDFPLSVKYMQPTCPGSNDQLRMYYLRRTLTGSPAVPLERIYVTEKPALKNQSSVLFPCSLFNAAAVGYCFVYVNMASDGSVTEQDDYCISNHPDTVLPIDGDWSSWSQWGPCSVSCSTGKQSRGRTCTDPTPAHGGKFCDGYPIEWRPCYTPCPDIVPDTPLNQIKIKGKCACGCTLSDSTGDIIGTGRCKGLSEWTISAAEGHVIILTFQYFNLLIDEQWIKIRDGKPSSDLLAQSYGFIKVTKVISSANKLLIQFMTRYNASIPPFYHRRLASSDASDIEHPSHFLYSYGFIASYITEVDNSTVLVIPMKSVEESSIWQSTVTIAGISLCVTIVIIMTSLAIYHRCFYRKKHKYAMAAHEETPTHIPKSTSMHSTPSHHSALSGVEIDYDMERPLTGTGTKKDSAGRTSRGSSISSTRSNGRKVKVKATVEKSPKPATKQYSPMPSPHIHAIKDDLSDKQSLFNTSPLLNRKPRSPKIHPSPRFKHAPISSKVKTPTSPSDTKYDLLIKRRRSKSEKTEKDIEERVVPGSDDTPVVDEKAFTTAKSPDSYETVTPTESKHLCVHIDNGLQTKDIPLISIAKQEETRNPASGASDESSSPDNNEKTTSFIAEKRPSRPTSLTDIHKRFPSASSVSSEKRRKFGERNKGLPQPDGESPKSSLTQSSKTSTPKSVHSSKSKLTLSPTRSIASENLEMEYDDFIDYDDPLSYFDPEELEKLKWKGVEKISPKVKEEDD